MNMSNTFTICTDALVITAGNKSIYNVFQLLIIMLLVLSISSLLTVLERKGLGSSQRRLGPSYNGWFGLIQIVMDGIKLVYKDYSLNINTNNKYIAIACIMNFIYSYLLFLLLYIDLILHINIPFLLFLVIVILMINHISIIICGIVINNSKWTMISSIRVIIVFIIYDVIFLLLLLLLSYNNVGIIMYYINNIVNINNYISVVNIIRSPIIFFIYLFIVLIESGRVPIDVVEAESELIAGYNIEYSGFLYALFASAEYSVMLFHTFLLSILFLSYYSIYVLFIFIMIIFILLILIRATLPRFKYTSLLFVSFYTILPISFMLLVFHSLPMSIILILIVVLSIILITFSFSNGNSNMNSNIISKEISVLSEVKLLSDMIITMIIRISVIINNMIKRLTKLKHN